MKKWKWLMRENDLCEKMIFSVLLKTGSFGPVHQLIKFVLPNGIVVFFNLTRQFMKLTYHLKEGK